jgi:putative membrane protein
MRRPRNPAVSAKETKPATPVTKRTLVLCVDRDDDLGRKVGIDGPVVGRDAVEEAARRLALADPEDSDANGLFAAV